MSTNKQNAAIVGVGAAACAVCCAGPILGFLALIGLGTIAGALLFGALGLVIAAVSVFVVLRRRRSRSGSCDVATPCPRPRVGAALARGTMARMATANSGVSDRGTRPVHHDRCRARCEDA
jgi:hypothetical protein